MKKTMVCSFLGVFLLVGFPNHSSAGTVNNDIHMYESLKLIFNGEEDTTGENGYFYNGEKNVPKALIYAGTTYVPLRYFTNMMGDQVGWDGDQNIIWVNGEKPEVDNSGSDEIQKIVGGINVHAAGKPLFVDSVDFFFYPGLKLYFNGTEDTSGTNGLYFNGWRDVPKHLIINGSTYVPLRYFAEHLGIPKEEIQWDPTIPAISVGAAK